MNVFLDLEGTIIDNWFDRNVLPDHIISIRHWLNQHHVTHINVLSYAVHSNHTLEKKVAEQLVRWIFPFIQTVTIFSIEDLCVILKHCCNLLLNELDFFELFSDKRWLLMNIYDQLSPNDQYIVLIDDSFYSCKVQMKNVIIDVKRIDEHGKLEEIP